MRLFPNNFKTVIIYQPFHFKYSRLWLHSNLRMVYGVVSSGNLHIVFFNLKNPSPQKRTLLMEITLLQGTWRRHTAFLFCLYIHLSGFSHAHYIRIRMWKEKIWNLRGNMAYSGFGKSSGPSPPLRAQTPVGNFPRPPSPSSPLPISPRYVFIRVWIWVFLDVN